MSSSIALPTSLINILSASMNNYDDSDPLWYRFIDDHRDYILANSDLRTISPSYMQSVRYNLRSYLRNIGFPPNCAWIVQLINDMPNDVLFNSANVSSLYVPPFSLIQTLYTSYMTTKSPTT